MNKKIEDMELEEVLQIIKTIYSESYKCDAEGQVTLFVKPGELNRPNSSYFTLTKEPKVTSNNYTNRYVEKNISKSLLMLTYYTHEELSSAIYYIKDVDGLERNVVSNIKKFERLFYEFEILNSKKILESQLKQKPITNKGALKI